MSGPSSAIGGPWSERPTPSSSSSSSDRVGRAPEPSLSSLLQARTPSADALDGSTQDDLNVAGNIRQGNGRTHMATSSKDESLVDWYVEGPGRRVGYDNMTAIDWIFEYTKERQRLRLLRSGAVGMLGYARELLDASQIWLVLIATGLSTGVLAASIDVVSDWLGDLKTGYCRAGAGGGRFYLNRGFCCWGLEDMSQCQDWQRWSSVLRVKSQGGGYPVEYLFFVLFSVAFAGFASILVTTYAMYARHSGIPEIKTVLGGFVIRKFMGTWTLVIKSVGLCLAVASGLWLGKEGPLVHVACCCANLLMKLFDTIDKNEARKREVLSAAAAAGISVAFGSPIGGVLFSLEQLSYYFPDKTMWQSFVCAMVAAVTLQAFNPFRTGKLVLYQVTYSSGWHGFEMVPFVLLGIVGGLYGGLFILLNMRIARWRRQSVWSKSPVLEVVAVALLTALVNYPNVFMRAQSSEVVYSLFAECSATPTDPFSLCATTATGIFSTVLLLLLAAVLGFLLSSLTFGLTIPAGIILPSMAIGALYGRALGLMVSSLQLAHPSLPFFAACEPDMPCVTPGTYAIIGAASALGGVTRMTVSLVVIMFELTGALTYVLPIMIAVMIAKWVGDFTSGKSGIYESWIDFHSYPLLDNRDDTPIPDIPAHQVFTRINDLVVLPSTGHTIISLLTLTKTHAFRGYPVVSSSTAADTHNNGPLLLGYISRTELVFALHSAVAAPRQLPKESPAFFTHQPHSNPQTTLDLRPWMDQTPLTLNAKSSLGLTVGLFQKLGLRYVLFTERGRLRGIATKKDIWKILKRKIHTTDDADRDDNARFRAGGGDVARGEERGLLGTEDVESPTSLSAGYATRHD